MCFTRAAFQRSSLLVLYYYTSNCLGVQQHTRKPSRACISFTKKFCCSWETLYSDTSKTFRTSLTQGFIFHVFSMINFLQLAESYKMSLCRGTKIFGGAKHFCLIFGYFPEAKTKSNRHRSTILFKLTTQVGYYCCMHFSRTVSNNGNLYFLH